ncbi:uncharacterized protein ASPGLDRAFT_1042070 [Aspergillus glaucus CBS 516.65]|uniref:Uncharacterized protein n=1 Tax=Aspergillus glaucus CBS 516.65 TaxID=1160497 RepID=A0A1L9V6J6_ASPGL|nr:hypothetical protein ASPGLDRAFT_1042070 [Aspergillus glaucus CBS 516.65]OJJ79536.1 hypothetical protein ASPGLDRAFT_1042070 [Aspergillus glaucus CBS 516.65]
MFGSRPAPLMICHNICIWSIAAFSDHCPFGSFHSFLSVFLFFFLSFSFFHFFSLFHLLSLSTLFSPYPYSVPDITPPRIPPYVYSVSPPMNSPISSISL